MLGTFVSVTLLAPPPDSLLHHHVETAIQEAYAVVDQVDKLLSNHNTNSELSQLNRGFASSTNWVAVSRELFKKLSQARLIHDQSQGAFDPTVGPLTELWGFQKKEYRLPSKSEISFLLPKLGFHQIEFLSDSVGTFLRTKVIGLSIDSGGFGKGVAVDQMSERLSQWGFTNHLVKAGGDLRCAGSPGPAHQWVVQIEDPTKSGNRVQLSLSSGALSTAGNYENYFVVGGQRYSHILNPRTGFPVQNVASCSVVAPTCFESDAWSTARFVLGPRDLLATQRFPARFVMAPARHSQNSRSPTVITDPGFPRVILR